MVSPMLVRNKGSLEKNSLYLLFIVAASSRRVLGWECELIRSGTRAKGGWETSGSLSANAKSQKGIVGTVTQHIFSPSLLFLKQRFKWIFP